MKFSVIIPSYLGPYKGAAQDRDTKIVRAINSVLMQSYRDFEVIVVSDGCQKTMDIVKSITYPGLGCYFIPKTKTWSGKPRNEGIEKAQGDYIVYLDIDDMFGTDHLLNIEKGLGKFDWVWFDDIRYHPKTEEWYVNPCDIVRIGRHGTSNICHKRALPFRWDKDGYAHDYYFIRNLRRNTNFAKIEGGEYYVCHIPGSNTGGPRGYDL